MKTILVLGGTGMLGAPVARRLQADGYQVRLLARDPDKAGTMFGSLSEGSFQIFPGSVTDMDQLRIAMEACDGVHISIAGPAELSSAQNVAALAPKLGAQRITYLSGATAVEANRWFPMTATKLDAEQAIRACSVPCTLFCPAWPMEQLPRFARGGEPLLVGDDPQPSHWLAAEDLARMVSNAYQRPEAANKKLFVHGPEAMTPVEALEHYCRAFHPEVESVPLMPVEAARATATSTGNQMLGFFAELMAYFEKVPEAGDPSEANDLLGAPAITLEAWIALRQSKA